MDSAKEGNVEGIKEAISAGADVNFKEVEDGVRREQSKGSTPLMRACWVGPDCVEGVQALIDAGADVNAKTPSGQNAIISAASGSAKYGNEAKDAEPLIDALVAGGAKADDGFSNGKTPLFAAVNDYDAKVSASAVKALLKHGANPNAATNDGQGDILTHVTWSAQQGDAIGVEAVKALVEAGANVNPKENPVEHHTSTPIGAAASGSQELTEYLLSKGANPDVVDNKGVSLLEVANANQREGIASALESALKPDGQGQAGSQDVSSPDKSTEQELG